MSPEFHIHANHFEADPPASLSKLENLGLTPKEAKIHREDGPSPLWLISRRFENRAECRDIAAEVAAVLQDDPSFVGYMETETMPGGWAFELEGGLWMPSGVFPGTPKDVFVDQDKAADIHVFRDPSTANDGLDELFHANGWFLVTTPTKRIWTILIEDRGDTNTLVNALKEYFDESGGVEHLEGEMVDSIQSFPGTFKMLPVVRGGVFDH